MPISLVRVFLLNDEDCEMKKVNTLILKTTNTNILFPGSIHLRTVVLSRKHMAAEGMTRPGDAKADR